ncbi:MAG: tetratricopeptide repeat protein [Pseudobdellovibrionaceae bacterium]
MKLQTATFLGIIVWLFSLTAQALVQAQISQQGDTVHLEFDGQNQWDYDLKRVDKKGKSFVEVTLPALTDASQSQLQKFTHPLVQSIQVNPNGPDGKVILTFQLASSSIEPFDYLTEKPSRLIIDFFKGQTAQAASKEEAKAQAAAPPEKKAAVTPKVAALLAKETRAPASTDALVIGDQGQLISLNETLSAPKNPTGSIFDGGDPNYDRFSIKDYEIKEDSIIGSSEKVYIDFPMLRLPSPYLEILQSRKPVYEIAPQDTEENKQARLLMTLFENKRFNVFLKTIDWFLEKYPQSQYDEMIRFMWADALYSLWNENRNADDFDMAMLRYRQALDKYPQSPLLERTMMLMGFATLDRGDYLGTLRLFQSHLQKRPASPNKDIARFAIADSLLKINRFDEASQIYQEIEKDAVNEKDRIQAAYLRGDVDYQKKDFNQSLQNYQDALKKYPQAKNEYPNAVYNQASAYFGLKDFKKSLELYREFLKQYPSHPDAGYAMTRVGEIQDILGADKTKVLGTYLETYFRFGDSPSAVVARLRMLSERMHIMKPKEVEKAVKDIQEFAKTSTLPKMNQFATLMISEGYNRRKEYDKAIQLLIKLYQDHPTTTDTKLVSGRIVKNINEAIKQLVDSGQFISALKMHNQYADNWLKSSNRIDTKYNIGRSFEQAGVLKHAHKLYQETLNQIYSMKGTAAAKERNVFEKLPTEDELNLRLAAVQAQQNQFATAYDSLRNIKNPQNLSDKDQIERVKIAAELLEKRGETESAIRYLTELLKEWSGIPELVADSYLTLAQLELKQGKKDDAIKSLKKVGTLMDDSQKVAPSVHARSLEMLGETQLEKGDKAEAIKTFEKLVSQYGTTRPVSSYRYRVGQLYFEGGEIKKASEVWEDLKNDKNDFWYKLAQEQLRGSEWKDEYKKYIKRIPAMSGEQAAAERK